MSIRRYLEKFADPNDEPVSPSYDQSFEDMDLPVERWKGNYTGILLLYQFESFILSLFFPAELVFEEVTSFVPQPDPIYNDNRSTQ